jgi:hypothetical protein
MEAALVFGSHKKYENQLAWVGEPDIKGLAV